MSDQIDDHSCPMLARQLAQTCDQHPSPWDCAHHVVVRLDDGRYGLPVRTGPDGSASSWIEIWHCPWCGAALPGHRTHPAPDDGADRGKALTNEEIDARIDAWHHGAGGAMAMHEYLGWTWEEYRAWAERSELPRD
ncbi:DUF6980 family protein [Cryptosporangium phraense]|uniref:DUF6980 domain-containing protein n=1 Tax=Cryptosporangium phraense TaxID=2593070 RepID=A0A545AI77_9ACTN|nr:hypothetical protein [Cryptosporangium phraense]TQS40395.1 hypothetical protein FL583_35275 [Cryptosporangium phraense]